MRTNSHRAALRRAQLKIYYSGLVALFTTGTALTVFTARTTCWTFFPTFRFFGQNLVRKTEFACLLVDFEELHLEFVTFLDTSFFYAFKAIPRDF